MHSPLTNSMTILTLGSLLTLQAGCLTLDAQQSKSDCLNFQECSGLNLRKAGALSENPQKDENDESFLFEVLSPREAQDGITVIVQSQRQCRSFRETKDLYRHNNPALFWTNVVK